MPELSLAACLELCRRAQSLEGDALAHVLAELQGNLEKLSFLLSASDLGYDDEDKLAYQVLTSIPPEPRRQPIMTLDMTGYLNGWSAAADPHGPHTVI